MPAQTQTRKIIIKVDTSDSKGLQEIANKMGLLNKNTKSLANSMSGLTAVFKSWVAYLGVREIVSMSDEVQNLTNRLKITAQAGEDVNVTFGKISDLANRTKQSVGTVGDVYNRLAISLGKIKPSSGEIISLTETLINTFRVSGSTAEETSNAMVQLSQAFSLGTLRGQDLKSVLSQNATLAQLLQKKFGANLFKEAEKGAIKVSTVLKLLADNQKEVADKAEKLSPTFGQTLTTAVNKVTVAVGELNKQFDLSGKFATVMGAALDNLGSIMTVLGGIILVVAVSYLPTLLASFRAFTLAVTSFAAANPLLLALTAVITVGALVYQNFDALSSLFKKLEASFLDFLATIEEKLTPLRVGLARLLGLSTEVAQKGSQASADSLRKAAQDIRDSIKVQESLKNKTDPKADLNSLASRQKGNEAPDKLQKIKEILGDVNKELLAGKITIEEYNQKLVNFELYKLNREFKEGKFDIFAYNQKLKELNIQELNRELKNGIITFQEFRDKSRQLGIDELNAKFQAGKISVSEYNNELIKLSDKFLPGSALQSGTASYIESIGTVSENVAKAISNTFSHLEDTLVDFIKTGEFNFAKFTQSILDDLTRIIVRATILRPLATGILGAATVGAGASVGSSAGAGGADYSGFAAKGMAFDNGVRKFAKGGIVDTPTAFRYGGGNRGLMGEAGTEAIVPLRRASNGDLGVQASVTPVTVNIINQTDSSVQQRETTGAGGEKTIDILISSRVRDGILSGKFDGAMKQSFGLSRKGS